MSTPEERLKQLADQLESQHGMRQQREQEEAAKQHAGLVRHTQEVVKESQAWLSRAQALVEATHKLVPVYLTTDIPDEPGFELRVGTSRIRAVLRSNGWHVVKTSPDDLPKTGLAVGDFARLRETILERMVQQGLRDLYAGKVRPAPDDYPRG